MLFAVVICVVLPAVIALGADAQDTLRAKYEDALSDITAVYGGSVSNALSQYGRDIDLVMNALKKKGKLDAYLLARKEKSRFANDRTVPEATRDTAPEIERVRQRCRHALVEAEQKKDRSVKTLLGQYHRQLTLLVKRLMADDRIEDAISVKQEGDKVDFMLADLASKSIKQTRVRKPRFPMDEPDPSPIVLDFTSPLKGKECLSNFTMRNPELWQLDPGELQGRSSGRRGESKEFLTYSTYFKSLQSVLVKGRLVPPSKHNFRMSVGQINLIFNWECKRQNHYRNGESLSKQDGDALVPGKAHDILVENKDEQITVSVDGKTVYTTSGKLQGTVTIYPCHRSVIAVSRIEIVGTPDPERKVSAHSHTNTY